jgi:hypothetical protein
MQIVRHGGLADPSLQPAFAGAANTLDAKTFFQQVDRDHN